MGQPHSISALLKVTDLQFFNKGGQLERSRPGSLLQASRPHPAARLRAKWGEGANRGADAGTVGERRTGSVPLAVPWRRWLPHRSVATALSGESLPPPPPKHQTIHEARGQADPSSGQQPPLGASPAHPFESGSAKARDTLIFLCVTRPGKPQTHGQAEPLPNQGSPTGPHKAQDHYESGPAQNCKFT